MKAIMYEVLNVVVLVLAVLIWIASMAANKAQANDFD